MKALLFAALLLGAAVRGGAQGTDGTAAAAAPGAAAGSRPSIHVDFLSTAGIPLLRGISDFLSGIPGAPEIRDEGAAAISFQVLVERREGAMAVETRMTRTGSAPADPVSPAVQSLRSTIATTSLVPLVSAIGSDILWLWASARGFAMFPAGEPPALVASLKTGTLAPLWTDGSRIEPIGIAPAAPDVATAAASPSGGDAGVLLCLSDRFLTLGPLFRVTPETMRDALTARESPFPGLLAAAAVDGTGCIAALDAEASRVDFLDPVTGRHDAAALPPGQPGGGKIAGLPDGAVVLRQGALYRVTRAPQGLRTAVIPMPRSFLTALAVDTEGDVWVFDATERRVRVLSDRGVEIRSIRPLIPRSRMSLPQEMAVFPDGSFLLTGSGEVWKFRATGEPAWGMTRLPGPLGETLPASMALAATADGCFYLLDAPGRRILRFSDPADRGSATDPLPMLSYLYGSGDPRDPQSAERIGDVARQNGLALLALQHAASMSETSQETVRRTLQRDMARAAATYGRMLEDGFLPSRAQPFLDHAFELYRAARERDPTDASLGPAIDAILADRKAIRDANLADQEMAATAVVRAMGERRGEYASSALLRVTVRNIGDSPLREIEAAACVPGRPERGSARTLPVTLAPDASTALDISVPLCGPVDSLALRISFDAADGRRTLPLSVPLAPSQASGMPPSDPLEIFRLLAPIRDPQVAKLLSPFRRDFPDGLECAANALEWLSGLRSGPPQGSWPVQAPRRTLRDLQATDGDWLALAAAVLAESGVPFGWVENGNAPLLLVRTDGDAEESDALFDGDPRLASLIRALSAGGPLCLPLSAAPVADATEKPLPGAATAASVAAGCRTLRTMGPTVVVRWAATDAVPSAVLAATAPSTDAPSAPTPTPAPAPPGTQGRLDRAMVAREIHDALAGKDR